MLALAQLCINLVCPIAIFKIVQAGADIIGVIAANGSLVGGEDEMVWRIIDLRNIVEGDKSAHVCLARTREW